MQKKLSEKDCVKFELIDDISKLPSNHSFRVIQYIEYCIDNEEIGEYLNSINSVVSFNRLCNEFELKSIDNSTDIESIRDSIFIQLTEEFLFGAVIIDIDTIVSYEETKVYVVTYDILLKINKTDILHMYDYIGMQTSLALNSKRIQDIVFNIVIRDSLNKSILDDLRWMLNNKRKHYNMMVSHTEALNILEIEKLDLRDSWLEIKSIESDPSSLTKYAILNIGDMLSINRNVPIGYKPVQIDKQGRRDKQGNIIRQVQPDNSVSTFKLKGTNERFILVFYSNIIGELTCKLLSTNSLVSKDIVKYTNKIDTNKEVANRLQTEISLLQASGVDLEVIVYNDIVIRVNQLSSELKTVKLPKAPVILDFFITKADSVKVNKHTKILGLSSSSNDNILDNLNMMIYTKELTIGSKYRPYLEINRYLEIIKANKINIREGVKKVALYMSDSRNYSKEFEVYLPKSVQTYKIEDDYKIIDKL